jgi:hypothetical protein
MFSDGALRLKKHAKVCNLSEMGDSVEQQSERPSEQQSLRPSTAVFQCEREKLHRDGTEGERKHKNGRLCDGIEGERKHKNVRADA